MGEDSGGGGGGGGSGPPTPGVEPPYPRPIFPPYPRPLFFPIIFRVPPPQIKIFRPRPSDPVPLPGDATALVWRTWKWTDTQLDRWDGLVEHRRRYYFACVSYQFRIKGEWVTHMRRIRGMNDDATPYVVVYENLTIAYPRRKWRMHSVYPTYARRSRRFYDVWWAYVQRMVCVYAELKYTPHYICVLWMWHLNVQLNTYVSKCPV